MASYKPPKAFKPAALDASTVEEHALDSKRQQLWHFTFPLDFNVAGFSELELHLPAEPLSSAAQVPQMVASFELDGASYRIIEGSVFETYDLVNLFPSEKVPGTLTPGKPFTRSFRICRDVLFPAPPKSVPVNPRGRAPDQLKDMRKNFFPLGFMEEGLAKQATKDEVKASAKGKASSDFQGRVLRSTSARAQSPRLLPKHGFDVRELSLGAAAVPAAGGASAASAAAEEAARKAAKAAKKEAKKRAAEGAGADAPPAAKKARTGDAPEDGKKKKKSKDKQ